MIDINSDMGELPHLFEDRTYHRLIDHVTSINIACRIKLKVLILISRVILVEQWKQSITKFVPDVISGTKGTINVKSIVTLSKEVTRTAMLISKKLSDK